LQSLKDLLKSGAESTGSVWSMALILQNALSQFSSQINLTFLLRGFVKGPEMSEKCEHNFR
jgi:hypothetical protein